MVLLVDVLVQKLCVKQTVKIVKTYLLKYVACKKLKNELVKARDCFRIVGNGVLNYVFHQKEDENQEDVRNEVSIYSDVDQNLKFEIN
jgi:hypothetical protein